MIDDCVLKISSAVVLLHLTTQTRAVDAALQVLYRKKQLQQSATNVQ
jgi:hypothetical protein